jgi:hypothetical protein
MFHPPPKQCCEKARRLHVPVVKAALHEGSPLTACVPILKWNQCHEIRRDW